MAGGTQSRITENFLQEKTGKTGALCKDEIT